MSVRPGLSIGLQKKISARLLPSRSLKSSDVRGCGPEVQPKRVFELHGGDGGPDRRWRRNGNRGGRDGGGFRPSSQEANHQRLIGRRAAQLQSSPERLRRATARRLEEADLEGRSLKTQLSLAWGWPFRMPSWSRGWCGRLFQIRGTLISPTTVGRARRPACGTSVETNW